VDGLLALRQLAAGACQGGPSNRPYRWNAQEIIAALNRWTRQHGCPPRSMQWAHAPAGYPSAATVRAHFGHFADALHAAGLRATPRGDYRLRYWRAEEILQSLSNWALERGDPPAAFDWIAAGAGHPCSSTVRNHFGTWANALAAAGLVSQERSRRFALE
jgi:hypothetical protein